MGERAGVPDLMYRFEFSGRKSPVVALLCLILYFCVPANASAQNRAPVISGTPPTSVIVGTAYSFTPTASDPDGQVLKFNINWKPSWASFSKTTGRLSGTPPRARSWTGLIISVSDGRISRSLPAFTITATAGNRPPVISGSPATAVTVGQIYSFTPTASDPDGADVDVPHHEQAGLGDVQHHDGQVAWNTDVDARWHLFQHRHRGVGRHHDRIAPGLLDCGEIRLYG